MAADASEHTCDPFTCRNFAYCAIKTSGRLHDSHRAAKMVWCFGGDDHAYGVNRYFVVLSYHSVSQWFCGSTLRHD